MTKSDHPIAGLLQVMERLRDPERGCPWDLEQDYASILPHTLEEAYEVADAIERGDFHQLRDELGDLLFQVVFYARMAEEDAHFDFSEVVENLTEKLVRRHPHVDFSDGGDSRVLIDASQVVQNWEQIKQEEREGKAEQSGPSSVLDDIPNAIPAISRARKLQRRAASVGFDWADVDGVMEKVAEEMAELQQVLADGATADPDALEDELGDLIFTCVNLSRHLGVDPEAATRRANRKFEERFRKLEQLRETAQPDADERESEFLERLWVEAKLLLGS